MAYSEEEKTKIIDTVCSRISEGESLRNVLKETGVVGKTFFEWIGKDEDKSKQYARATNIRADVLFEEILDIADETSKDFINTPDGEKPNQEVINRSRLRIDARKWYLSKVMPKKYGDKLDVTTDGETLNTNVPVDKWIKKKGSE